MNWQIVSIVLISIIALFYFSMIVAIIEAEWQRHNKNEATKKRAVYNLSTISNSKEKI